jgi:serine/threonine-protein kinase ULK/ATG1
MPKQVDNYILERKIGAGQFGEVYKGFNKLNGQDIAVKVVRRELLTGKFLELLENEIKVLRACDNPNIIKLYDLKKTSNNFYLVLEFCNEGDMGDYLKTKKWLTEDEAVDYLLQILNGFKSLVKNNILHRDFKLANILKHNGIMKIADFGFSKLLGKDGMTGTMLGSPLNMAPEVLDGGLYTNKVDIWSIGTVFFELLFGKPAFAAGNLIDLIRTIKAKKLEIPRKVNNISPVCEDLLRRMLTVDVESRITWEELFNHKITTYREEKIKKELNETLKTGNYDLMMNISRFYINNNKVVNHVAEINKKEELNNFAIQVAKGKKENEYNGAIFGNREEYKEEEKKYEPPVKSSPKESIQELSELSKEETAGETLIKVVKRNSNRVLHERNKYVFLASVAEETITKKLGLSEYVGFILIKKLLMLIEFLKSKLAEKKNLFNFEEWEYYTKSREFQDICKYIVNEYEVFEVYFNCMYERIINLKKVHPKIDSAFLDIVNKDMRKPIDKVFEKIIKDYVQEIIIEVNSGRIKDKDEQKELWLHADQLLDCIRLDDTFKFEDANKQQFNFKQFYEQMKILDLDTLSGRVKGKFAS